MKHLRYTQILPNQETAILFKQWLTMYSFDGDFGCPQFININDNVIEYIVQRNFKKIIDAIVLGITWTIETQNIAQL